MRVSMLLSCCLFLGACASGAPDAGPVAGEAPSTRAECLARGGEWKRPGRLPVERCLLPTTDAGRACTDAAQCQGLCLAADGATDGAPASGRCSADTDVFGCRTRVEGGRAVTLCVD